MVTISFQDFFFMLDEGINLKFYIYGIVLDSHRPSLSFIVFFTVFSTSDKNTQLKFDVSYKSLMCLSWITGARHHSQLCYF
jgi:hypothetical protein